MLKATVAVTLACLGIISVGGVAGHAQVTQRSKGVVAPEASVESVSAMQNVDFASFTLRAVKGETPALRPAIPFGRFSQPSRSNRQGLSHDRRNASLPAPSLAASADSLGADSSAHTSKVIAATVMTPACVAS
jgi:hypothetical protein